MFCKECEHLKDVRLIYYFIIGNKIEAYYRCPECNHIYSEYDMIIMKRERLMTK